ncbi:hypothetical protein AURDEDRAFT_145486 [Auricularia subglabra TFB-10046 SS5]|nr:hypothetical protein AURDEDRAFT_145486 [Auricularia subglabra TFB-10046 SS5]
MDIVSVLLHRADVGLKDRVVHAFAVRKDDAVYYCGKWDDKGDKMIIETYIEPCPLRKFSDWVAWYATLVDLRDAICSTPWPEIDGASLKTRKKREADDPLEAHRRKRLRSSCSMSSDDASGGVPSTDGMLDSSGRNDERSPTKDSLTRRFPTKLTAQDGHRTSSTAAIPAHLLDDVPRILSPTPRRANEGTVLDVLEARVREEG